VATALEKKLEELLSEFTSRVVMAIREATLDDLRAGTQREPEPRPAERPILRPIPAKSTTRPAAPARLPSAPKRASSPERTARQLEEALLRELRSGVLLTMDEVVSMSAGRDAPKLHTLVEDLVARGLVGVLGEGPERLVFAARGGRPAAPARSLAGSEPTTLIPAEVQPEPGPESRPIDEAPPVSTETAPGSHPFVVRRKKAAEAT